LKSVSDSPPFFLYTAQVARARPTKVGELTIPRLSSHSPAVASHLAIEHVPLAQAALLKKFGKSDVYDFFAEIRLSAWADFADNRPIVGTEFGTMVGTAETAPDASASRLKCAGETT